MIDFIKSWVLNIVTLVFFILILEMLLPSGKIKKFVNLISGFILVIALINPFLGLMRKGVDLKEFQIKSENYINRTQLQNDRKVLEERHMEQVTRTYRKKVLAEIEGCAKQIQGVGDAKADIIINEDHNSPRYGEIKRVYLEVSKGGDTNYTIKPVAGIQQVRIGENGSYDKESEKKHTGVKEPNTALVKDLEEKIGKLFGISSENVVISVQNEQGG